MTDFESEKFYQDLRQKLEGYGSAPPDSVWEGIREQVPVRKRRRRPALLLLAAVLLIGLTVGTRQWKPLFTTTDPASVAGRAPAASGAQAGQTAAPAAGPHSGTGNTVAPLAAGAATGLTTTAAADKAARPATASASNASPASGSAAPAGALVMGQPAGAAATGRKRLGRLVPGATADAKHSGQEVSVTKSSDAGTGAEYTAASSDSRRARHKVAGIKGLLASTTRRTARRGQQLSDPERTGFAQELLRRRALASRPGLPQPDATAPDAAADAAAGNSGSRRRRATRQPISNAPLALLVVKPATLEVDEPAVERAPRTPRKRPSKQELRLRNWSGQLLLGSGLSYRLLGGSPTQLEQLERPSLGFSGQVSATYALSRQLSVSAGLGYAEYATSLRYQLKKTSAETTRDVEFRDVYRFLTIPVQAQLSLGGTPRWRYGVLGGGALGILAGAQTTEGSACNCQQTNWVSTTKEAPFTRTNLLLTGGAFASYQFALGQWLTVRPQGQIFLNSLTTPASGRTARRPWTLGVQVGYSWDLDPRKH